MKEKEKQKKAAASAPVKTSSRGKTSFQIAVPHLVALGVFIIITLLYFSPLILDNKMIKQSDILHVKGASKELADYRNETGKEALWTNSMFGGMPAYQINVVYKGNLVRYFDKILSLNFPHPSQYFFLAFACFYLLLLMVGVSPWLSIIGAIAYGLCSYNLIILEVGHNSKMHSIALLPLVVAGVLLLGRKKYLWGGIVSAIALSLLVYANHLQITFYLLLLMMVYAVVELINAIKEKDLKHMLVMGAIVIVAGIFSFSSNLSLLWSTYDYVPATIRGPSELSSNKQSSGGLDEDYAFGWSYGKMETFTLLIPNVFGGSSAAKLDDNSNFSKLLDRVNISGEQKKEYLRSAPAYWGEQPSTAGPVYVGAIVVFLFVLGLFLVKERWRWWLLSASLLAIMLAWGKNFLWFNDLFFHYFPGYNKFRTVSMALVIVQFTFPFLAIVTLSKIVRREYDKNDLNKKLKYSFFITAGLCLVFALFGNMFFNFKGGGDARMQKEVVDAMIGDRKSMMRLDAIRSLILILQAAGLIWLYVNTRMMKFLLTAGLALLIFADLFLVGKRYLDSYDFVSKNDYNAYFEPSPADQLIGRDPAKDYRVFNLAVDAFNDSHTSYFHKSVGGYHAAKLRRYQEIIEHQLSNDSTRHSPYPFNKSVVDMLNTKYIIVPDKQQGAQVAPNPQAMNNAWFADSIRMVNNADEEMAALDNFNPVTTVIVDKRFSAQLNGLTPSHDSTASVTLESYAPNDLVYKSKSSRDNVIVFSEIYYQPGWDAFVDSKKADHFRCNYILRGMRVPAGDHTIEFKFEPQSFFTGEKVAYASSGILLLLLIGILLRSLLPMMRKPEST